MDKITTKLKERFCKDYNLPIRLYKEPYFYDRIELFDKYFDTVKKWELYIREIDSFNNEQDYLEYYNKTKDNFINNIKSKPEYETFINFDMNNYAVPNYGIGRKSVFKEDNIGKRLISIDLTKANYSAMKFFNSNLVDNTTNYNQLISRFTDLQHLKNSKYVRQVVFGNLNPKRQVAIEKYMMNFVMEVLLKYMDIKYIQTYMGDEIVFEYFEGLKLDLLYQDLGELQFDKGFELHREDYILKKIPNSDIYVKHLNNGSIDFKCVDNLLYPFVIRAYNNEEVKETDKVFFYEGYLSKLVEIPTIEVV